MGRQFAAEADDVRLLQGKGLNLLLMLSKQPAPARDDLCMVGYAQKGKGGEQCHGRA